VFFINDVPLIRARVPSVLWFIIGFLLFHSPLGLIHNSSFLNIQSDVTRIFPTLEASKVVTPECTSGADAS